MPELDKGLQQVERPLLTIAEVVGFLGIQPRLVKSMIASGELKTMGMGKTIRVLRNSVEEVKAKMGATPPVEMSPSNDGHRDIAELSISEEAVRLKQALIDRKAIAEEETKTIQAEILRDEAVGRRDNPAKLAERERVLQEREELAAKKEGMIKDKEVELANRTIVLGVKEKDVADKLREANEAYALRVKEGEAYCVSKKVEADNLFEIRQNEADDYYEDKKSVADVIDLRIAGKAEELAAIEIKIVGGQKQLDAIVKTIQGYLPKVVNHATQHYQVARATTGWVSTYHDSQANRGWGIERKIKNLLKWLTN